MQTKVETTQAARPEGVVPRLRFPAFEGGWEAKNLKGICEMQAGAFVPAADIQEIWRDDLYPCFGGNGLRGYSTTYTHDGNLPLIGRQGALCGNVNFASGKFHATEHAVVASPKPGIAVNWLYFALDLLNLNRFATGQAQPGLSVDVLARVKCSKPPKEEEQRKIADCLSSLDACIGAEIRKLDALKAHKQGLMQQLFPAEGQRLPQRRFSPFRNDAAWVAGKLADVAKVQSGGTPSRTDPSNWGGDIPWVTTSLIDSNLIVDVDEYITRAGLDGSAAKIFAKGTLLMAMYGQGKTRGKVAVLGIDATTNQACAAISVSEQVDATFLFHNLAYRYAEIRKISNPGGQENLSGELIKNIPLTYPKKLEEQQEIAACLSSLEGLTVEQSRKIAALKTHKQGLMQGLFPVMESQVP